MAPSAARRVFLVLTLTRWFPVGLVVTLMALLPVERGLSLTQALTLASVSGFVVLLLELPTAGVADSAGRRPVLLAAAAAQVVAVGLYCVAHSFWAFALGAGVMGAFRALDSGPLEAWYVDAARAGGRGGDVNRTLSLQGTVLGASIAAGALVSGVLVWWHPVRAWSALTLPFVAYAALACVHLTAVALLLREDRRPEAEPRGGAWTAARRVPATIMSGLRLAAGGRVLACLLLVEVFWSTAMVVFESFTPLRMGELLGSEVRAGAVMGPVAALGWGVFALGSALAGVVSPRFGVARTAILARLLNGLGAVWMGLVAGPVALVAAYLVTYGLHGMGGPVHSTLLHREAESSNRATVLSLASMTGFASYAIASPLLGRLADTTSTPLAMTVGGAFSMLGAALFIPALRKERQGAALVDVPDAPPAPDTPQHRTPWTPPTDPTGPAVPPVAGRRAPARPAGDRSNLRTPRSSPRHG